MRRHGFTLVETLVAVGIVVVCAAILLPALNQARARATQVQISNNLRSIGVALVTYKNDFKGYFPPVIGHYLPAPSSTASPAAALTPWYAGYEGAIVLCQALVGPGDDDDLDTDGVPQMGFRIRPGERVYGPYLPPDQFKVKDLGATRTSEQYTGKSMSAPVICDSLGNPILYFPASSARPNVRVPGDPAPYVGSSEFSRYDLSDNIGLTPNNGPFARTTDGQSSKNPEKRVQLLLGDRNMNGVIDANETEVDEPYLLWSPGPDGKFGPEDVDPSVAVSCDDVTNFR